MDLADKTVVITGAGLGIGRAIAVAFARARSNLALIDLNAAALEETCRLVDSHGAMSRAYVANVANEAQMSSTTEQIVAEFGRLDGLVNNAGIVRDSLLIKVKDGAVVGKMSLEQWQAVIDVNLTGVFICGREVAERMIGLGNGGVIVNISSVSRHGNIGQSNYSAAKAGVVALTEVWARELARYNIRTGSIAPGFVRTEILSSMKPEILERVLRPVLLGRLGQPDEIAKAARFIFENDFFMGRCLEIDGGIRL
jgi:3-oxoacyl-[acyl-carrier protein] reductase